MEDRPGMFTSWQKAASLGVAGAFSLVVWGFVFWALWRLL
jgi:hypothetical protein